MAGTVRAGSTGVAGTVRIIVVRVAGAGRGGSVTAIIITVGTSAGTTTSTTTTGAIATKFWCFPKKIGPSATTSRWALFLPGCALTQVL
ncbi:protein of unknown function [Candidatus Filomicrobium marinum]|uniref:hypothetical protein n=1 Tax=Candidatus Filomicrobium marinum TaxID=1608628 RepID=UPI0005D7B8EF|nr:hypothetical protein [Candidatus Filomicrobium marinum]CFX38295.1 protein of unknown function [Candidatus Filomicrobium marinum]